jgi:hypothetical protein
MPHLKWISGAIIRFAAEDDRGSADVVTGARVAFSNGWLYVDLEHSVPPRSSDGIMVYPAHRIQHVRYPAPDDPADFAAAPESAARDRVHVGEANGQLVW